MNEQLEDKIYHEWDRVAGAKGPPDIEFARIAARMAREFVLKILKDNLQ
jgi:hypothetical protein